MKVKIVKCKLPTYWYRGFVGEIYDVIDTIETDYGEKYKVVHEDNSKRFINCDDCEVLNL